MIVVVVQSTSRRHDGDNNNERAGNRLFIGFCTSPFKS